VKQKGGSGGEKLFWFDHFLKMSFADEQTALKS